MSWLIYSIPFSSFAKQLFLGSDEIVDHNRCCNVLKKCTKFADEHTHLRWCEQLIKRKFPQCAPSNLETNCLLEITRTPLTALYAIFSVSATEKKGKITATWEYQAIQAAVTMEFAAILKDAFTSCFQDLQKCWQHCIDCGRAYFEEDRNH
jgi:hypothetical protein